MIIEASTTKTGLFRIVTNDGQEKFVEMKNVHHGFLYDTVGFAAAATIPATGGIKKNFFQDVTGKQLIDCNISTSRRMSNGERMLVRRVGLYLPTSTHNVQDALVANPATLPGTSFARFVIENGYFVLKLNKQTVVEGPIWAFPAGFGAMSEVNTVVGGAPLAGATNLSLTLGTQNGLPASGLISDMLVEQWIESDTDIDAYIEFQDRTAVLTAMGVGGAAVTPVPISVKCVMSGIVWGNS